MSTKMEDTEAVAPTIDEGKFEGAKQEEGGFMEGRVPVRMLVELMSLTRDSEFERALVLAKKILELEPTHEKVLQYIPLLETAIEDARGEDDDEDDDDDDDEDNDEDDDDDDEEDEDDDDDVRPVQKRSEDRDLMGLCSSSSALPEVEDEPVDSAGDNPEKSVLNEKVEGSVEVCAGSDAEECSDEGCEANQATRGQSEECEVAVVEGERGTEETSSQKIGTKVEAAHEEEDSTKPTDPKDIGFGQSSVVGDAASDASLQEGLPEAEAEAREEGEEDEGEDEAPSMESNRVNAAKKDSGAENILPESVPQTKDNLDDLFKDRLWHAFEAGAVDKLNEKGNSDTKAFLQGMKGMLLAHKNYNDKLKKACRTSFEQRTGNQNDETFGTAWARASDAIRDHAQEMQTCCQSLQRAVQEPCELFRKEHKKNRRALNKQYASQQAQLSVLQKNVASSKQIYSKAGKLVENRIRARDKASNASRSTLQISVSDAIQSFVDSEASYHLAVEECAKYQEAKLMLDEGLLVSLQKLEQERLRRTSEFVEKFCLLLESWLLQPYLNVLQSVVGEITLVKGEANLSAMVQQYGRADGKRSSPMPEIEDFPGSMAFLGAMRAAESAEVLTGLQRSTDVLPPSAAVDVRVESDEQKIETEGDFAFVARMHHIFEDNIVHVINEEANSEQKALIADLRCLHEAALSFCGRLLKVACERAHDLRHLEKNDALAAAWVSSMQEVERVAEEAKSACTEFGETIIGGLEAFRKQQKVERRSLISRYTEQREKVALVQKKLPEMKAAYFKACTTVEVRIKARNEGDLHMHGELQAAVLDAVAEACKARKLYQACAQDLCQTILSKEAAEKDAILSMSNLEQDRVDRSARLVSEFFSSTKDSIVGPILASLRHLRSLFADVQPSFFLRRLADMYGAQKDPRVPHEICKMDSFPASMAMSSALRAARNASSSLQRKDLHPSNLKVSEKVNAERNQGDRETQLSSGRSGMSSKGSAAILLGKIDDTDNKRSFWRDHRHSVRNLSVDIDLVELEHESLNLSNDNGGGNGKEDKEEKEKEKEKKKEKEEGEDEEHDDEEGESAAQDSADEKEALLAVAKFSYEASNADELTISKGEELIV
eukprot:g802.t1